MIGRVVRIVVRIENRRRVFSMFSCVELFVCIVIGFIFRCIIIGLFIGVCVFVGIVFWGVVLGLFVIVRRRSR